MCTRALLLLAILTVCVSPTFATQVLIQMKDFGNVRTRVYFDEPTVCEQPNKVCIIGELAQRLAAELSYTGPILLDFPGYGASLPPQYLVSFDKGEVPAGWYRSGEPPVWESPGIVIRQYGDPFTPGATLTLLEYAINNTDRIQSEQRLQEFDLRRFNSVDFTQIQQVLRRPVSPAIERVWKTRTLAPYTRSSELRNPAGISYGFENGLFVACRQSEGSSGTPLLSLKDIYYFKELSYGAVVFDTSKSFYYIRQLGWKCSRRHTIEDTNDYLEQLGRPYEVMELNRDKLAIRFTYETPVPADKRTYETRRIWNTRDRVLIYSPEHDDVIQDLDSVFDEKKAKASETPGTPPKD